MRKVLTADGTFWPIPVTLSASADADAIKVGEEIALYDDRQEFMATMKVTEKYDMSEAEKRFECEKVFKGEGPKTADDFWEIAEKDHPGVQMVMQQKDVNLAGPVKVLSEGEYPKKYNGVYMPPAESRQMFEDAGGHGSPPCSCATPCTAPTSSWPRSPLKCATASSSTP